ncbi:site-specific integrase [Streptococcus equi]|uniref:site-specific integrase n=1 Tax=Streptococcus equi TaxID=1336 RepID=UPI001A98665A|nr:site-specific integrase [Streptococcus equi]MDI5990266.1 site-specific integrase [Streptococcus equi subsp. zooepidemicus]HEL0698153.1 site-specific integrase [Streptococcus equi subsp. zooepidemicus]HEL0807771.1 site-specific integrase [Streptococcus equi subsp. zooepidemicus]HEL1074045.1 site-specific integrase [Streptococcus equi subsp. zooepidemicus]
MSRKRRSRSDRREAKKLALLKQQKNLQTVEGRYTFFKSIGLQNLVNRFKDGKGKKRHDTKSLGEDIRLIHTDRTFYNYAGTWDRFSRFLAENTTATDVENLKVLENNLFYLDFVNKYLTECMEIGLSPDSQATYKAALGKVLGVPSTLFIPTAPRYRAERKNNRTKDSDNRLSKKSNEFWKKIVSATGLRKQELRKVTGDALVKNKVGTYYLHLIGSKHGTKGRRDRWLPIIARNESELDEILDLFNQAGSKKVFNVPNALKPHKYRADYACRLYKQVARDPYKIQNSKEVVKLRKELAGIWLDRKACWIVSRALGHNRADEFRKSYAYKLWQ